MFRRFFAVASVTAMLASSAHAAPAPGEAAFRELYRELVETNTTLSAGDCTVAASQLATRLKAAGYPEANVRVWTVPVHPKEGGLFAPFGVVVPEFFGDVREFDPGVD